MLDAIIKLVGAIVVFIVTYAVSTLLVVLPIMVLWNLLMPELLGLKAITIWQALGLYLFVTCFKFQIVYNQSPKK